MTSDESLLPIGTLPLEPIGHLATAASVFVGVNCTVGAVDVWADWNAYGVVLDYVAGTPGVGLSDLVSAENLRTGVAVLHLLSCLAAGIMFLAWLWRARGNAEQLSPDGHRMRRGWVIGGWIVPVVNFWFPYRVVLDIWRASRPADVPAPGTPVRNWWAAWVATMLCGLWLWYALRGEITLARLREVAAANTVMTVVRCAAAGLAVLVIRRISQWQSIPRPLPPA